MAANFLLKTTLATLAGLSAFCAHAAAKKKPPLINTTLSSSQTEWKWSVLQDVGEPDTVIRELCLEIDKVFDRAKWGQSPCSSIPFKIFGWSALGRPLVVFEIGDISSSKVSLLQCTIHGDELTALPMCFELIAQIMRGEKKLPPGMGLYVQPLLNPDGFLAAKPTRANARGVDLNRNFLTNEWAAEAQNYWEKRDRKDPRKFPGPQAASEPETRAITDFIKSKKPQKILSIHTPLGFLELDTRGNKDQMRRAKYLAINMVENSKGINFKSYGVWPGSLGNFAGLHLGIPVFTLELPPGASPRDKVRNWNSFRYGLWRALQFDLDSGSFIED